MSYPLSTIARAQQMRLLSNARRAPFGAVGASCPLRSLGDSPVPPFDLNGQATVELKLALVALAKWGADPLRNPSDPILERLWQRMATEGSYADSWDGPSADELVTAISRHAPSSGILGPYVFLRSASKGAFGINGGPQPTPRGLEVIAGAVNRLLGGHPRMSKYLAWRGGTLEPPSEWSGPSAEAACVPNHKPGPYWQKDGYTFAVEGGPPEIAELVTKADEWLIACWDLQRTLMNEAERVRNVQECLLPARQARDEVARLANKGVLAPSCPEFEQWDYQAGKCTRMSGVLDLEEVRPTDKSCIEAYKEQGKSEQEAQRLCNVSGPSLLAEIALPLVIGGGVGGLLWWLRRRSVR